MCISNDARVVGKMTIKRAFDTMDYDRGGVGQVRVRQERISRVEKVFTTMDGRPEGSTDTLDGPECQEPRERQAEKSKR